MNLLEKKCLRVEPCFAPLKEEDAPQNTNLRSAFFLHIKKFYFLKNRYITICIFYFLFLLL